MAAVTSGRALSVVVAVVSILVVGCSGSSSTPTSSATGSPSVAAGADGAAEASRSADQIYNDSLAAMRHVDHVRLSGTQTDDMGRFTVSGDVTQSAARVDIAQNGTHLVIGAVGGKAYASQDGSQFVELSAQEELRAQASTLSKTLDCAAIERGHLTKGAISTIKGIRVIAIDDDGKAPGDAPNITYVALDGSLHVVESRTTGKATPGGTDACGHSPNDSLSAAVIDYDYTASLPAITPPPNPQHGTPSPSGPII